MRPKDTVEQLPPARLLAPAHRFDFLYVFRKYPQFRRFYIGLIASVFSHRLIVDFSLIWLIQYLTEDPRYLGYMGAAIAVPAGAFTLLGGVCCDKLDPRRLLGLAEAFAAAVIGVLGLLVITDLVEPWHALLAGGLFGAAQGFDEPGRISIYPRMVDRTDLGHVVPMNSFVWPGSRAVAPFVAGLIVDRAGFGTAGVAPIVFMGSAGFLIMATLAQTLTLAPAVRARGNVIYEIVAGLSFIRQHTIFLYLVGFSFFNAIFGMSYMMLMPVFATDVLDEGPDGMGMLMGSQGLGSIVGLLLAAGLAHYERRGVIIIGGAIAFGTFVCLFALSPWFWLSLCLVFMAGLSNALYLTGVMTVLQILVPNEFRGRVIGVYTMTYGMIPLGALQSGFISAYVSPQFAVAMGGSLVVFFAIFMALFTRQVRAITTTTELATS